MNEYIFVHDKTLEIISVDAENEIRAWAILLEKLEKIKQHGDFHGWTLQVTLEEED